MVITLEANPAATLTCRGRPPSTAPFTLSVIPVANPLTHISTELEQKDANLLVHTGATVLTEALVDVQGPGVSNPLYSSLNTNIATVDQDGMVSHVANGKAPILVKNDNYAARVNVSVSSQVEATTEEFESYKTDSLAYLSRQYAASIVAGTVAGVSPFPERWFQPGGNGWYGTGLQWNTSNWAIAAGVNFHPINMWMESDRLDHSRMGPITLVHPRIALGANHIWNTPGTENGNAFLGRKFIWKDAAGVEYTRTVTARKAVPRKSPLTGYSDIEVLLLDEALPESIGFLPIFPANWRDYFPSIYADSFGPPGYPKGGTVSANWKLEDFSLPLFFRCRRHLATITNWYLTTDDLLDAFSYQPVSPNAALQQYLPNTDGGNSSRGMAYMMPGGGLVHMGGPSCSFHAADWRTEIETTMDDLLPGATMTVIDLSAYPNYGA